MVTSNAKCAKRGPQGPLSLLTEGKTYETNPTQPPQSGEILQPKRLEDQGDQCTPSRLERRLPPMTKLDQGALIVLGVLVLIFLAGIGVGICLASIH